MSEALKWEHTSGPDSLLGYRIIASGLRARAHRAASQPDASARALSLQANLLEERQKRNPVDEHLRPLALAEGQLAALLAERGDPAQAGKWLSKALEHVETYMRRTKVNVATDRLFLALLWLTAELHLGSQGQLGVDFAERLRQTHDRMLVKQATPPMRGHGRMLEMYLPLVPP
jgi:hypothetical protein